MTLGRANLLTHRIHVWYVYLHLPYNKPTKYIGTYMGVSENRGTPKSSILIGFSTINHPFLGYLYFWKHPYTSPMDGWMSCLFSRGQALWLAYPRRPTERCIFFWFCLYCGMFPKQKKPLVSFVNVQWYVEKNSGNSNKRSKLSFLDFLDYTLLF